MGPKRTYTDGLVRLEKPSHSKTQKSCQNILKSNPQRNLSAVDIIQEDLKNAPEELECQYRLNFVRFRLKLQPKHIMCNSIQKKRIRPMQWLTPMIGLFQSWATVLATTATETSGAPIPGPKGKKIITLKKHQKSFTKLSPGNALRMDLKQVTIVIIFVGNLRDPWYFR